MKDFDPDYEERQELIKAAYTLRMELAFEKLPWCYPSNYRKRGWWSFLRKRRLDQIDKIMKVLQDAERFFTHADIPKREEGTLTCVMEHEDPANLPVDDMYKKGYYLLEQKFENGKYIATFTNWR